MRDPGAMACAVARTSVSHSAVSSPAERGKREIIEVMLEK
jgi:hypothetical protein